jgi:hypothetical protein
VGNKALILGCALTLIGYIMMFNGYVADGLLVAGFGILLMGGLWILSNS